MHTFVSMERVSRVHIGNLLCSIVMMNRFNGAHKFYCRHKNLFSSTIVFKQYCLRLHHVFFSSSFDLWKIELDKPPKYVRVSSFDAVYNVVQRARKQNEIVRI